MAATVDLMNAEWRYLVFLNWEVESGLLERYLPDGVELDTHHGRHYVSLVGLMFLNARLAGIADPIHAELEQVNLRFYAKRPAETGGYNHGVVFIRQIVGDLMPALGSRSVFNENAAQMPMRHAITMPNGTDNGIGSFQYEWATGDGEQQRWHRVHAATHGTTKHVQSGSREEFLTHRLYGFSGAPGRTTLEYRVEHPRWRIWPASSATLDCDVQEIFGRDLVPYISRPPALSFVAEGSDVAIHLPHGVDEAARG